MATTAFLTTSITSIPSKISTSQSQLQSQSSVFATPTLVCYTTKDYAKRLLTICKAANETSQQPFSAQTKRSLLLTSFALALAGNHVSVPNSNAAILEADDDEELMEKVKQDRKKRLERQGVLNSSNKETGYLQEVVYKLSQVGQAIENNDLSSAISVLGGSDWVKNANAAFSKLSSSPEENSQVDTFNSSLSALITSVTKNDVESSKTAFVASASAFEKWSNLTGLNTRLKGL